jgi:hypothetical protein
MGGSSFISMIKEKIGKRKKKVDGQDKNDHEMSQNL